MKRLIFLAVVLLAGQEFRGVIEPEQLQDRELRHWDRLPWLPRADPQAALTVCPVILVGLFPYFECKRQIV